MTTGYTENRQFSDRFIPQIKLLVAPHLLAEAPLMVDQQEATDLIVMRARDMKIACRIRRPEYRVKYAGQFTIRSHCGNNAKTELAKIVEGFADWMFYGFAVDDDSDQIKPWYLISLDAWRAHMIRGKKQLKKCGGCGQKTNSDNTKFAWFKIDKFPSDPPLLIASSNAQEQTTSIPTLQA